MSGLPHEKQEKVIYLSRMRNKYRSIGLNYDLIVDNYPDVNEYEEIVNAYLDDEFFHEIRNMLEEEDYAMAKDATKGLYILASELYLYPLYERLLELYEDLEYETYRDVHEHYRDMIETYEKIRGIFHV